MLNPKVSHLLRNSDSFYRRVKLRNRDWGTGILMLFEVLLPSDLSMSGQGINISIVYTHVCIYYTCEHVCVYVYIGGDYT